MGDVKRVVCLANSRKLRGRCVAGREWADGRAGPWIRPVSEREGGAVSEFERKYEDGGDPRVLDVIDVPLLAQRPGGYQTENWLLDSRRNWTKVGRLSWFDLPALADPVEPLWIDGIRTYHGRNDKVPLESVGTLDSSLRLIHVDRIRLDVFSPGEAFGNPKRCVRGTFRHAGTEYALRVTDPEHEGRYLAKLDGAYQLDECYLTISVGEPFQGACYKLIAAIIAEEGRSA